ncbi:MAG TPA: FmdB family zinc ribbon protein [Acidobacteriota bacterium]|nr:FmdB family zinc ribbon protein [Acidobacteriota bacterium]
MPLYEYQCLKCKRTFEIIQKFSDQPVLKCPACKGEVERLLSAPAIQFKGSGWYVTDYSAKSNSSSKSTESKGKEGSAEKESKPETKKEPVAAGD